MKTNEMINLLKEKGFYVDFEGNEGLKALVIYVHKEERNNIPPKSIDIARINIEKQGESEVYYENFDEEIKNQKEFIENLIKEYDNTKLEDRNDETKYTISTPSAYGSLNLIKQLGDINFLKLGRVGCMLEEEFTFTKEEINKLPNQDFIKSMDINVYKNNKNKLIIER